MKRAITQLRHKYLWFIVAINRLVIRQDSFLHSIGWIESIKRGYPCRDDGTEVPWMNYSIVNLLKERLGQDHYLFEFGSGYSTLFYSNLVKQVISIEYDQQWFKLMQAKVPGNVSLVFKDKDVDAHYCRAITEHEQLFDVVIVDGRDRVNCLKQAIARLSDSGVIILDDSARPRYQEALAHGKSLGFRTLSIDGIRPSGASIYQTTIFYRDGNCLDI